MSINNAILGILSYKSLTGYDLKKIIQESSFMHWSGNNNQIYKALVELLDDGYVTNEVHHQTSSPSKKIYTITEEGKTALKNWVLTTPEAPEFKKTFLIQLAWSEQLNTEELKKILTSYENEIRMQILMQEEKKRRECFTPNRTSREVCIWEMIHENIISSYQNELTWVQKLRKELGIDIEEVITMKYNVIEKNDHKYLEFASTETPLNTQQEGLDIIAACWENGTHDLMLHADMLSEDFFQLKTGLAGHVLQKFVNYGIRAAVILTDDQRVKGRFKEFLAEANKGKDFRIFNNKEEAEKWLLDLK